MPAEVTVAIPTYRRESVLLEAVRQFLAQDFPPAEIIVVDQTPDHELETESMLARWNDSGAIRWIRQHTPSQPQALNRALVEATRAVVLFVDDDIRIGRDFVAAHAGHYDDPSVWGVAGQVLQPGQFESADTPRNLAGPFADVDFPFHSASAAWVANGMSGNLSVRREKALEIGGFDENFIPPVSYRFDNDFCKRLVRAGGRILYDPAARIHHLRAPRGGTRSIGSHLTSASPLHGVGDYYFALRQGISPPVLAYVMRRPCREVRTRFHLKRPWWIPVKLMGEIRAFVLAVRLLREGPRLLGRGISGQRSCRNDG